MEIEYIIEALLFTSPQALRVEDLQRLLLPHRVEASLIKESLTQIMAFYEHRSIQLVNLPNGYYFQTKTNFKPWVEKLFIEKGDKYSKAFLETLAIIAYNGPVTRMDIESIRGVSVNNKILKQLQELNWISIVGHQDTPGKPLLYGTTNEFLSDFGLTSLSELPPLT